MFDRTKIIFWIIMLFLLILIITFFILSESFNSNIKIINMLFFNINVNNFQKNIQLSNMLYIFFFLLTFALIIAIILWFSRLLWKMHINIKRYQLKRSNIVNKLVGEQYFEHFNKEYESNDYEDYFTNSFNSHN